MYKGRGGEAPASPQSTSFNSYTEKTELHDSMSHFYRKTQVNVFGKKGTSGIPKIQEASGIPKTFKNTAATWSSVDCRELQL